MILQLLSLFKTCPDTYCTISKTGKDNHLIRSNLNFYYVDKALMLVTLGWLCFSIYMYSYIYERPHELFAPMHYFGAVFMPSFPSPIVYFSIILSSFLLTISILLYKDNFILRIILTFFLLWINVLPNSLGFQHHVAHTFILTHLFRIFIPTKSIYNNSSNKEINQSIEWMYLGILITYVYSGIWKWIGVVYKLTMRPNDVNWLSPTGALYNAFIEFHISDLPFEYLWLFDYPLFWQLSFLAMTSILTFSFFAAFRHPLRVWTGFALIVFHIINSVAFNVHFFVAPMVLAYMFFPFDLILSKIKSVLTPIKERDFQGRKSNAQYTRIYKNGDADIFKGFYAYREKIYDKRPLLGGLLYTPFLDLIVQGLWSIRTSNKTKNPALVGQDF